MEAAGVPIFAFGEPWIEPPWRDMNGMMVFEGVLCALGAQIKFNVISCHTSRAGSVGRSKFHSD